MKTYSTTWRNKWLTSSATSIDEMIKSLQSAVSQLQSMKNAGLIADFEGAGDDYIYFRTEDEKLAKEFDLQLEDWDDEEEIPD